MFVAVMNLSLKTTRCPRKVFCEVPARCAYVTSKTRSSHHLWLCVFNAMQVIEPVVLHYLVANVILFVPDICGQFSE